MHSEHTVSARTAIEQPADSGARFPFVAGGSEFTFLRRRKLDWLATRAATPPAPSPHRHQAGGHGHADT
jgi:hypothetical protein